MAAATVLNETMDTNTGISYSDISKKLLNDRLFLTALELHTELLESGREVKQLKDFFSNPGNFESQTQEYSSKISRSGSQTTLDSLDFARFSEDGERGSDERIAVLEFELRKAKETISALRNNLTVAIESEQNPPDKSAKNTDGIKPHEQRALNFLINEYLLMHSYKLTSITFSDENEDQDFEDWDDVGLNISKPSELLILYREGLKQTGHNLITVSSQTDIPRDEKMDKIVENLRSKTEGLTTKVMLLESEVTQLQNDNDRLLKQYESSQKSVNILTETVKINPNPSESSKNSVGSISPEHFVMIETPGVKQEEQEDNISNISFNTNEWLGVGCKTNPEQISNKFRKSSRNEDFVAFNEFNRMLSDKYKKELLQLCPVNTPVRLENDILESVLNNPSTTENIVHTLSESLLRIIPNIILNKREEAIPLLISAVHLNPDSGTRDKLLQQLFNLKKKPNETERALILTGISGIAKYSKENVIENELLPQCWEQLTHKHLERRLLVAESCRVLIPFVSPPIRNSLMLSMLQQMLDDREEIVREEVIKALALVVAFCDDIDKYSQCEELAFNALKDSSNDVVNCAMQTLFPVIAKWALDTHKFLVELIKHILHKLNESLKLLKSESPNKLKSTPDSILRLIHLISHLLPFVLMYVVDNEAILERIEENMKIDLRAELLKLCSPVTNPMIFFNSKHDVGMMLYEFDKYIGEENVYSWPEIDWITDVILPDLLNNLNHIDMTQYELLNGFIDLFSNFCMVFGKSFTEKKIRPLFQTQVENLEQILSSFNQYSPSLNVIPVYLVSVLSYCDVDAVSPVLKKFLCALPLCGTPLNCLEVTVRGLCQAQLQEIVVASLWEGVVHQRPLVRAVTSGLFATIIASCSENLLNAKVTPALVTLANDSDILVRTATIPALGCLITDCSMQELHDKSYMQLQMFLSDPTTKENHTLLRQLVVTLGNIVINCKASFRQDVILPQFISISTYMSQMSNQSRKVDMAIALIEAYSNVIYSPLTTSLINNLVLPGLRYLEQTISENQTLQSHRDALYTIVKECENRVEVTTPQTSVEKGNKLSQNVNQGVEEMKQRVSKMFNKPPGTKPPSLPNLQNLFKKK